jgi:hypothetical protein
VWGHTDNEGRGVVGVNNQEGTGVWGETKTGRGVVGVVNGGGGTGVWGHTDNEGRGVVGVNNQEGIGVWGETKTGRGVVGVVNGGGGTGVWGHTNNGGRGVVGTDDHAGVGVWGEVTAGDGVVGVGRRGVVGRSPTFQGVYGESTDNAGIVGESAKFHAIFGISHDPNNAGVYATNDGGGWAGRFDGRVAVNGDLSVSGDVVLAGADVAEQFDVAVGVGDVLEGTVMVLDDHGCVGPCRMPYDTRVAGIVSGAGDRHPALVLDRRCTTDGKSTPRSPIAVVGKAWCLADATREPIAVGDLLTTSRTAGHAMRATDRGAAFGAVIGKALTPLAAGTGQVLVLIGLA